MQGKSGSPALVMLAVVLAAVLAAGVGFVMSGRGAGSDGKTEGAGVDTVKSSAAAASAAVKVAGPSGTGAGAGAVSATSGEAGSAGALKAQIATALEQANPTQRLAALARVLEAVTPANWREGLEIFSEQAKKFGRSHYQEWLLYVQRAGEVAGADAMKHFAAGDNLEASRACLTGWASVQPKAAVDWIETEAAPGLRDKIFGAAVRGIVQKDAALGLSLVEQLPVEIRHRYAQGLMDSVVQARGIEPAVELFNGLAQRAQAAGTLNSEYVRTTFEQLAERVLKMNRMNKVPERSAAWLSAHLGRPYVGAAQIDQVAADYAGVNPAATVAWLDSIQAFPGGEPVGYRTTIQTWVEHAGFDAVAAWLAANRRAPNYDRMAIGLATRTRDPAQFQAIVATISSPDLRERAMKFAPGP